MRASSGFSSRKAGWSDQAIWVTRVCVASIGVRPGQRQHLPLTHRDMLPAQARQAEGDLGLGPPAEDGIGPAVARRCVPHHGEASLAGFRPLLLVVFAARRSPPPLPVDVRAVGGVHEADDRLVDVGVEHHAVDQLRPSAHHAREYRRWPIRLAQRRRAGPDEDHPLALGDRIAAHPHARDVHRLVGGQRGDRRAGAVRPEAPAVVGTGHGLDAQLILVEAPRRQRRGAMRADIAQGEQLAAPRAPQNDRLAQRGRCG